LVLVATAALQIAGLGGAGAAAGAPPPGEVSFSTIPSLFPSFSPEIPDYVVRCNDGPVTVEGNSSTRWEWAIGNGPFRRGPFVQPVPLGSGQAFRINVREVGVPHPVYRYNVRCLPNDFPNYTFTRYRPVSPKYFTASRDWVPYDEQWGMVFDRYGVPIWWIHAPAHGTRVLPDGNILWSDRSTLPKDWEIHRLDGSFVRTLGAVGRQADDHDVQFLPNGDHLVAAHVRRSNVDTSAYGGSSDATVLNTELQRVTPSGQLVWSWRSWEHISLSETPSYRWPWAIDHGYDIEHWNSIEPAGDSVIVSFRNLDAVYKIRRSTGNIVWKLGGTRTPKSLKVIGDSRGYTFGAQHDPRLLGDGTLTVFDNRTNLGQPPRAVRFRINEQQRTATLLESITDPNVRSSACCGSARRLGNGDWLIDFGSASPNHNLIGGYKPNGARTFRLTFETRWSSRAEPVPTNISPWDFRHAMNGMCSSGCS
jgi:hypothetical protein